MRKILITNDDGFDSKGIVRLAKAAKKFGEVYVVAPDSQRSAASHSLTLRHSIKAWEVDFPVAGVKAYASDGFPADCVRIGVLNIVHGKPDVIFAGINNGYNLASDLQYSATAAAAFEGAFQGIKSIAFSEENEENTAITDGYLEKIIEELIDKKLERNEIWNVNFPGGSLAECKGILRDRVVSMNDMFYRDIYHEEVLPDGKVSYTIEGIRNFEASEGTDLRAVIDNYISIGVAKNIS